MTNDTSFYTQLGYGQLDLTESSCDDVAAFTNVRHPQRDQKFYARELLRLLGKRFADEEARLIWQEIEGYRTNLAERFGPPGRAEGKLPFEQAARTWYDQTGRRFEKAWWLSAPLDLHFARNNGREKVRGRWLRWLHSDLLYFVEAGFSPWQIAKAIFRTQEGMWPAFRLFWQCEGMKMTRLWVVLAANLFGFQLTPAIFDATVSEVADHTARLSRQQHFPVAPAHVALDYFRRLELAGLRPQILLD